jgi:hypothetical protein
MDHQRNHWRYPTEAWAESWCWFEAALGGMDAFSTEILLLRPIARRVRQRALVIVKPNPIAHVDIAVAHRTFPEVFGLGQWRSAHLFADHGAARPRLVDGHDHGHGHLS